MALRHSFYKALFVLSPSKPNTVNDVATRLNILPSTAKRYLKELVKLGYVREGQGGGYVLTETGKLFRESILSHLRDEKNRAPYIFTDPSSSQPIPLSIRGLKQLYALVKYDVVEWSVLEHHVKAGYLSKWIKEVVGDVDLATRIDKERDGINKNRLLEIIEERIKIIEGVESLRVRERI